MRGGLAIAALLLAPFAGAAQETPFDWLAGEWRQERGDAWTTEHWQRAADGTMAGQGNSGRGHAVGESETMTIALDGFVAVFTARPTGAQAPTQFRETARGVQDVTFENPGHDYPQRIRYWREGDELLAEISLKDGSRAMRWRYRRVE